MTDPWRRGTDPILRLLRIIAAVVCLGVFVHGAVIAEADTDRLPSIFLAVGCLMVLLGYEGIVRLPGIGRGPKDDDDDA